MSAKAHVLGHEIVYENGKWVYSDTKEVISERTPDSWADRCSGDGHKRYVDENGDRRYRDNNEGLEDSIMRPCANCGHYPSIDGDDFCIQRLGSVVNACCGHGSGEGYIMFDNGITIRGHFRVERNGAK